jgi:hypothetical protein
MSFEPWAAIRPIPKRGFIHYALTVHQLLCMWTEGSRLALLDILVTCAEAGTRHNQLGSTGAVGLSMAPTF